MIATRPEKFLKTQVLTVVFASLTLLVAIGVYSLEKIHTDRLHNDIELRVSSVEHVFEQQVHSEAQQLLGLMKLISDDEGLVDMLTMQNREKILQKYSELYRYLNQNFEITHFYFTNAQRKNILRLHNPDRFGDVINRFTTVQAEKTREIFYGVELGKFGQLSLRLVKPVYRQNQLIGFIELGKEIESLIHKVKLDLQVDLMVMVYKKFLKQKMWESGMQQLGREAKWDNLSKSVLVESTLPSFMASYQLMNEFSEKHNYFMPEDHKTDVYEMHVNHELDVHEMHEGKFLFYIPIYEVDGDEVGDLVVVLDYRETLEFMKQENQSTMLIGIIIVVVMSVLLYVILQMGQNTIVRYRQQLLHANETLEMKVADRTLELEKAKLKADEANLEKSRFLANMSHELRTPMHAINNFATLALKYTEHEKATRFLQNIRSSGIRLTGLLNDLLDLSKIEAGKMDFQPQLQDLTTLFEQSTSEVASLLADKDIQIELDIDKHFECSIDQKLMTQLMINLLSNAIKFSPQGSVITLEIDKVSHKKNGYVIDYVRTAVIDQGVGIPDDELNKIFNKFEQSSKTRTDAKGTGLGLAISKEIIELHNGRIWAESPPKGRTSGSVFYFEIPMNKKAAKIKEHHFNDLEAVINSHIDWTKFIDASFVNSSSDADISVALAANSDICSLGLWLNRQDLHDQEFETIKLVHKEFHDLVGEFVAYASAGNSYKAKQLKKKYLAKSAQLVELIRHHKSLL